jgi:hypothetical protein
LARVLLLQHRTGLSDEAAMEAIAWDLRWKIALGLGVDHEGWHPTTLVKFRARLLLHGRETLALENTLCLAEEIGLLDGTAEQIIDSTPMLGAAATQDTVRLVRHGVRRLLDAVRTPTPTPATSSMTGWRLTTPARTRSPTVAGVNEPRASGCSLRSPRTPNARCKSSNAPTGCWAMTASTRRIGCCAS